nr:hypothetical protein [Tanacetum cinerariifolium]
MKSIQIFLEEFNYIPFGEKPQILFQAWYKFFAIQYAQPKDSNELFQTLLEDLQIIKKELIDCNHLTFFDDNSSKEIATSSSNQEKEGPPQDSDIRQLIREECCIEVSEKQMQNMEDTILELVEICRHKELLCMHDNVDDLIESALNSKLFSINSQHLNKKKQEVKNVVEQSAERQNRIVESLKNFKVIHKSSISLKNTSQISSVHAVAPILSTKEPEHSPSMGYENPNTTSETKSDEIIKSGVEELVPILSENEVTSEDKWKCDMPVCENYPICDDHSDIFSDSKNDDDISSDDDDFEDIEYVEASLPDLEIVSIEEDNVVHQEEEEVDIEDVFQIQDIVLREKLLSINRLIANIQSLNDNPTPDRVLNFSVSFPISEESDNSISDNFSPEFKTFCDHTEETRSGNITTHADDSLLEYDSFFFEIEPDQERLINVVKNNIPDDSSNDPLLEEADLFLASDNSIPPGNENFANDSEGDIRFVKTLLSDDSIPFPNNESSESDFDNTSIPLPPPEPPDAEEEIPVVMNDRYEFDDDYSSFMCVIYSKMFLSFLSAESEDTIFDQGFTPHQLKSLVFGYLSRIPHHEPSQPAKKLRDDYGAPGGPTIGGKSHSSIQRLLAGAVQNTEVRGGVMPALPFVLYSVSTTPEREGGDHTELLVGANLRTTGSLQRTSILIITSATTTTPIADPAAMLMRNLLALLYLVLILLLRAEVILFLAAFLIYLMVDEFSPPKIFTSIRGMDHDQLFTEFNVGAACQISLSAKVLKTRDKEIENLKAQLLLKEAEAAEAIRLHAETSQLEAAKKSLRDEVTALNKHNTILEKERNALYVKVMDLQAVVVSKDRELTNSAVQLTSIKSHNDNLADR